MFSCSCALKTFSHAEERLNAHVKNCIALTLANNVAAWFDIFYLTSETHNIGRGVNKDTLSLSLSLLSLSLSLSLSTFYDCVPL